MKTKLIIDDITDTELVTRIEKTNINAVDENNNEEAMDEKIITIDNDVLLLIKNYHFSNDHQTSLTN